MRESAIRSVGSIACFDDVRRIQECEYGESFLADLGKGVPRVSNQTLEFLRFQSTAFLDENSNSQYLLAIMVAFGSNGH